MFDKYIWRGNELPIFSINEFCRYFLGLLLSEKKIPLHFHYTTVTID